MERVLVGLLLSEKKRVVRNCRYEFGKRENETQAQVYLASRISKERRAEMVKRAKRTESIEGE